MYVQVFTHFAITNLVERAFNFPMNTVKLCMYTPLQLRAFYDSVQVDLGGSRISFVRRLHCRLRPVKRRKLVTVLHGRILDVAVDFREESPQYGKYVIAKLLIDGSNPR